MLWYNYQDNFVPKLYFSVVLVLYFGVVISY